MSSSSSIDSDMHCCLRIAEIQATIFSSLTPHDCSQLSRTCRLFYEQAMDVVWADVCSLVPFVKCMPSDVWVQITREITNWPGSYCADIDFIRKPRDSDWRQSFKHAHRVKRFTDVNHFRDLHDRRQSHPFRGTSYKLTPDATKTVIRFVCQWGAEQGFPGLFPGLTRLRVASGRKTHWLPNHIPFLSGGSLQSFGLDFGLPFEREFDVYSKVYSPLSDVLLVLRPSWPHLHSLTFSSPYQITEEGSRVEDYLEDVIEWVQECGELHFFRADLLLHSELIESLAALPHLRSLHLKGAQTSERNAEIPNLLPSCFRSLSSLKLEVFEPDSPIPILRALRSSIALTTVDLELTYRSDDLVSVYSVQTIFETVAEIPLVETFRLQLRGWENSLPESYPALYGELLAMLSPLSRVQHLTLKGFYDTTVTDKDLEDAAKAWPKLEIIELDLPRDRDYFPIMPAPQATLVGVQSFYNACPGIKKIILTVSEKLPMSTDNLPLARPRESEVENLILGFDTANGSTFAHGSDVYLPKVIRLMFPQLKQFGARAWSEKDWATKVETSWTTYRDMDLTKVQETSLAMISDMRDEVEHPLNQSDGDD
ncbi:hypothetical protein BDY19DRAFT_674011 [Irpex rosettiformis]|uniref:Uncharacterized protein n=1 Tax=Irpex rosettiformis TaxID=378272 RepID=A0ACB8U9T1_9APHY|nr:hypothetical protein BDY19DRAFT_674011 [Irpex rosettiformis]